MKRAALHWPLAFAFTSVVLAAAAQNAPAPGSAGATAAPAASAAFTCGGVGNEDQQRMKAEAPQHSAMLTFAATTGAYVADVDVQIRGARAGAVVSGRCNGPIMLVDLPDGSWQVTAQYNGQSRQKTITTARGKHTQATFVWPADKS